MIPPKRFDIFPDWGMLRKGLDALSIFFFLRGKIPDRVISPRFELAY